MEKELSRTSRFRLRIEAVAWQNMEPEAVLVQLEREEVHVANPVAAVIVEALQSAPATIDELVARVTDKFDVDAATAMKDIEAFVRAATEAGVLEEQA